MGVQTRDLPHSSQVSYPLRYSILQFRIYKQQMVNAKQAEAKLSCHKRKPKVKKSTKNDTLLTITIKTADSVCN